jgi:DNA-binding SARP family transcriptional activator
MMKLGMVVLLIEACVMWIALSSGQQVHTLYEQAEEALVQERWEQASELYEQVLALEPEHEEATLRKVELLSWQGEQERALGVLKSRRDAWSVQAQPRAMCLEAGVRMEREREVALKIARRACKAGAEDCCL